MYYFFLKEAILEMLIKINSDKKMLNVCKKTKKQIALT
jgi:hypothetical protein